MSAHIHKGQKMSKSKSKTAVKPSPPLVVPKKVKRGGEKTHAGFDLRTFIVRILAQVHPDTRVSGEAKGQLNGILYTTFQEFSRVCAILLRYSPQKEITITSRTIQTATQCILPGELAKHAVKEGIRAVTKYKSSTDISSHKKISRSFRAGLQFPVGRIERYMRKSFNNRRMGGCSSVYLAAVLEYLSAEVLELSGNAARDMKIVTITPRSMILAIRHDDELFRLWRNASKGMAGGVIPNNIPVRLLGPKPHVEKLHRETSDNKDKKKGKKLKKTHTHPHLRNNIQGLTEPAIKRLLRQAGVKGASHTIYQTIRDVIRVKMETIISVVVTVTQCYRRKTFEPYILYAACEILNIPLVATVSISSNGNLVANSSFRSCSNYQGQLTRNSTTQSKSKPHRWRHGTVALREIKYYQKLSNSLVFPHLPFYRLIGEIVREFSDNGIRLSKRFVYLLQLIIENYSRDLLQDVNLIAIHSNRVVVYPKDVRLARVIYGERN